MVARRCLPYRATHMRDRLYMLVARNRFRWFGRRETCYMPDPRFSGRMLG